MLTVVKNRLVENSPVSYTEIDSSLSISDKICFHNTIINLKQKKNIKKIVTKEYLNSEEIVTDNTVSKFIKATRLEKWNNGTYDLWEVGFQIINASEQIYSQIEKIEISLFNKDRIIARRVTVKGGVQELMREDIFYGGLNGNLSCSFKIRDKEEITRYWQSTPYNFDTPDRAEIRISIIDEEECSLTTYVTSIVKSLYSRPKLMIVK